MIWAFALPGPRVVNIRERALNKSYLQLKTEQAERKAADEGTPVVPLHPDYYNEGTMMYAVKSFTASELTSDISHPSILFVCREAFEVASKVYKRVFSLHGCVPAAYFSFQHDTLYLRYDNYEPNYRMEAFATMDCSYDDEDNIKKVESIAVLMNYEELDAELSWNSLNLSNWLSELLFRFQGAKQVLLVVQHYEADDDASPMCFIEPFDYHEAWSRHQSFVMGHVVHGDDDPLELPVHPRMKYLELDVDLDYITEECRRDSGSDYQLPQIEWKMAMAEDEYEDWLKLQERARRISDGTEEIEFY